MHQPNNRCRSRHRARRTPPFLRPDPHPLTAEPLGQMGRRRDRARPRAEGTAPGRRGGGGWRRQRRTLVARGGPGARVRRRPRAALARVGRRHRRRRDAPGSRTPRAGPFPSAQCAGGDVGDVRQPLKTNEPTCPDAAPQLGVPLERIVRVLLARLPPGGAIAPHRDGFWCVHRTHRLHVPLVTCADPTHMRFAVGASEAALAHVDGYVESSRAVFLPPSSYLQTRRHPVGSRCKNVCGCQVR